MTTTGKKIVMHIKPNYFHRKGSLVYKIKTLIISISNVLFKLNYAFSSTRTRLWWLRIRTWQSQAGESARSQVTARSADGMRLWAARWLVWRSPRRLWSSEGSAEGVLGNHAHRTEAGSWLREGRGEGGVREGRRIRAGCPSVPTAGLVLIKQNRLVKKNTKSEV